MSLADDAYDLWKDNQVTRAFFEHLKKELSSLEQQDRANARSIEEIAIDAIATQSQIDCIRSLISWRPEHGGN